MKGYSSLMVDVMRHRDVILEPTTQEPLATVHTLEASS